MENYSLETMEKLVKMVEENTLDKESALLLKQMVLDEFERCMSCNPSATESDCPYRSVQSYGVNGMFWKTRCILLHKNLYRDSHDYDQEEYLSDCPYLKLINRIK